MLRRRVVCHCAGVRWFQGLPGVFFGGVGAAATAAGERAAQQNSDERTTLRAEQQHTADMPKELGTKQFIQRVEGVAQDGAAGRARVLSVTQETIGKESTDSVRLLEKMGLGRVRFVASTTEGNTALVRCFAPQGPEEEDVATTLLTASPNIGMLTLLFQLME